MLKHKRLKTRNLEIRKRVISFFFKNKITKTTLSEGVGNFAPY